MFRYIAFSWISESETQAAFARNLETSILRREGWSRAFSSGGLQVYAAGCASGVNEVYNFPSRRGVVLGRLFRRADSSGGRERTFTISDDEDDRIVKTDGRALIQQFWGRWVAFLPSWTGQSRVLRDPSGGLPCYQLLVDNVTITFSWLEDVLQLLQMSCHDRILLRLSGGVDSTILLGSLLKTGSAADIACLNYYSAGSDSDERGYARGAAASAGCRLIERHRDDDFHLHEVLHPAREPVPSNHLGRLGSDRIDAQTAEAVGSHVMFTGAGGDQLFQEIRATWPAADYLQLRGLDRHFPHAVMDAARLGQVSFWRALQLAFRDRWARRDPVSGFGQHLSLIPQEGISDALRQARRFTHPGLLTASDLPIGKLFQVRNLICPVEYYNPYRPESSPEAVHPLLSQPLLELCLTLPTYLLTHGGRGRALAREAFADRIPPAIAHRRSKGGIDEHATAVLQRSLPLVRSVLLDGQLVRKGLLDRASVETALAGRPSATGAYVAEVHSCFAVEAWLSQILGGPSGAPS